jgi:hypothetical protein
VNPIRSTTKAQFKAMSRQLRGARRADVLAENGPLPRRSLYWLEGHETAVARQLPAEVVSLIRNRFVRYPSVGEARIRARRQRLAQERRRAAVLAEAIAACRAYEDGRAAA